MVCLASVLVQLPVSLMETREIHLHALGLLLGFCHLKPVCRVSRKDYPVFNHTIVLSSPFYSQNILLSSPRYKLSWWPTDSLVIFHFFSTSPLNFPFPFLTHMSPALTLPAFGYLPSLRLLWSLGSRASWPLRNYPRILYLFTYSDLKTTLLPVVRLPYLFSSTHD